MVASRRIPGRGLRWFGASAILVGLVLLGYVGWQYVGTNIVARERQQATVEALRDQWRSPDGTAAEPAAVALGDASALVRIPRFGDSYEMPVLEGSSDEVLGRGFGHLTGTADPGRPGNYVISAHRVTHGEPLRRMPDLRPGDVVEVETGAAVYTYVLDTDPNDLVVDFSTDWVLDAEPVNPSGGVGPDPEAGGRLITLTTCSELFHTDDRMVVFGHLESVDRR